MKKAVALVGMLLLTAFSLSAENGGKQGEIGLYGGWFTGDDVVEVKGAFDPEIDNAGEFGIGMGFYFGRHFGMDLQTRYIQTKIDFGRGSSVHPGMDMLVFDVDGIFSFNPDSDSQFFMVFGPSYALADQQAGFNDRDSFGANLGFGVKAGISENVKLRFDVKYRWFDQLVDLGELEDEFVKPDSSNTFSTTLGLIWLF